MQNKGLVIVIAVLMTVASIFYLSFSARTYMWDRELAEISDPIDQQEFKDSVKYLGLYNYQKCLETQIGLGLDLKGGMNVILEISVPDVVDMLADHKTDPAYKKAMEEAQKQEETSQTDFISLFIESFHKNAPGRNLASIFATQQLQGKVNTKSTDAEVEKVLRSEVQAAIDNSFNVVRARIDKFGVVQPNIQKLEGQDGRIMVEMPGVKEPERMRKLLQGSANLEFWETYNAEEVIPYLQQLNSRLANGNTEEASENAEATEKKADATEDKAEVAEDKAEKANEADTSSTKKEENVVAEKAPAKETTADKSKKDGKRNLFDMLQPTGRQSLSLVGYANIRDTAEINKMLHSPEAEQIIPTDMKLLWSAKPADSEKMKYIYELHALKITQSNGRAPLEGDVITDAKDQFDQVSSQPEVSMSMNADGARRWAELTKANVGKAVAIVLDDAVYSAPRVNGEISGGNSSISGNFTVQDTKDLANTLKSGRMPARARIVQEEVVGPSLGAQSIKQGITSFVIAFVLLMIYMVVMYNVTAGMMANLALIVNLFFTLGILTSFQAALTMSGIAGMVLSLGTAVDANVLIYERIKEEMKRGLGIKQALKAGYDNAFSAIFDSNLTSILTGIILFVFGTGPIQGFATTWIIGILCSFFTAVFLTRVVFESRMKKDKWLNTKFCTGFSKNLMQNSHVRFMSLYKKTFVFVGICIVAFVASFFVRGLSQGIDFTGGRNYVVVFQDKVQPEDVRVALEKAFPNDNRNAIALGTEGKTIRISTNYKINSKSTSDDEETESKIYDALSGAKLIKCTKADFSKQVSESGEKEEGIVSSSKVGPSVAKDITYGAIISVMIALVVIFLYILLRFRNVAFSVGSVVALTVDVLVVLGIYSLCYGWMPFSLEIDQTFIGALLTVVGYSINDKVVVFDRIRENLRLHKKQDYQTTFNDSINQTLARTINTSVSTLLVLLCIFFLGGDAIRSFSFAMILGVVFGTLSSIFIASPVAYLVLGRKIEDRIALDKAAAEAEK